MTKRRHLLVGDALQSQAFVALTAAGNGLNAAQQAALVRELALASGSIGMAGGQAIDLESVGRKLSRPSWKRCTGRKPAHCCARRCAWARWLATRLTRIGMNALDAYSAAVGLAFQVVDDILDVTADSATLGKTAGKDAKDDKPTYVSIIGLDASRELAAQLRRDAHAALRRSARAPSASPNLPTWS